MVRHFLLTVGVPAEARKLLGRFVSGEESDAPQITTADFPPPQFHRLLGESHEGVSLAVSEQVHRTLLIAIRPQASADGARPRRQARAP